MKRLTLLLVLTLFTAAPLQAHVVLWWDGLSLLPNSGPVRLIVYPTSIFPAVGYIDVVPGDAVEECTVTVKLEPLPAEIAKYVKAEIIEPNPEKKVSIRVSLIDFPPTSFPLEFQLRGSWSATGQPDPKECTAVMANPFSVPVAMATSPFWLVQFNILAALLTIDTGGFNVGLQEACSPLGPWKTIGIGSKFSSKAYARSDQRYFRGITRVAGELYGTVWDGAGKPQTGITIELPEGGAGSALDSLGSFRIASLPYGNNEVRIWKPIAVIEPMTAIIHTQQVGLHIEIPTTETFTRMDYWFDATAFPVQGCKYTGWAAIGLARVNKSETWLYYDGGSRPIGDEPRRGSGVEVMITPPSGMSFQIGRGQDQEDYTPNPKPGIWKITTTLCGESRSLALNVPLQF